MRYMGSKNRLAKDIVPIIQSYIIRGGLQKIELFARQTVEGWDCWGNEV